MLSFAPAARRWDARRQRRRPARSACSARTGRRAADADARVLADAVPARATTRTAAARRAQRRPRTAGDRPRVPLPMKHDAGRATAPVRAGTSALYDAGRGAKGGTRAARLPRAGPDARREPTTASGARPASSAAPEARPRPARAAAEAHGDGLRRVGRVGAAAEAPWSVASGFGDRLGLLGLGLGAPRRPCRRRSRLRPSPLGSAPWSCPTCPWAGLAGEALRLGVAERLALRRARPAPWRWPWRGRALPAALRPRGRWWRARRPPVRPRRSAAGAGCVAVTGVRRWHRRGAAAATRDGERRSRCSRADIRPRRCRRRLLRRACGAPRGPACGWSDGRVARDAGAAGDRR